MDILVVVLFVVGLVMVIIGGDKFVDGAVYIAKIFKLPEIIIGATIVSLGTTLPEILVSSIAAVSGSSAMATGNALGSIIFNTCVIAGITQVFACGKVDTRPFNWRVIFYFISCFVMFALGFMGNLLTRQDGLILLVMLVIYIVLTLKITHVNVDAEDEEEVDRSILGKQIVLVIVSAFIIFFGANLMVENATIIARYFHISERVIGLTIVAFGTSLPELVTAISAMRKNHMNMSLGNIIGANMLNILAVVGVSASIGNIPMPASVLFIDIPLALLVMGVLCIPAILKQRTFKVQGYILLAIYVGYMIYLF